MKRPNALEAQQTIFNAVEQMYRYAEANDESFEVRDAYLNVMRYLANDFWKWYKSEE